MAVQAAVQVAQAAVQVAAALPVVTATTAQRVKKACVEPTCSSLGAARLAFLCCLGSTNHEQCGSSGSKPRQAAAVSAREVYMFYAGSSCCCVHVLCRQLMLL
jgi:hypothetical protein